MAMGTTSRTKLLQLLFHNDAWELVGDASGLQPSAAAGSFYVALHTADPGSGEQDSNEVAFTGYARKAVGRIAGNWTIVGNAISNAAAVQFDECTALSATATHFSVGTALSGAGTIIYSGALSASRAISAGITPLFNTGALAGTAT